MRLGLSSFLITIAVIVVPLGSDSNLFSVVFQGALGFILVFLGLFEFKEMIMREILKRKDVMKDFLKDD
jgi:hypothetical protein